MFDRRRPRGECRRARGRQYSGRQVRTAVALRELPAVADAIVDGALTVEHGQVLARLVGRIEPQALLSSQPVLIEVARRTDPGQLAVYIRHLLATWCEPQLDADEAAAEDRRFLHVRNTHRGSWCGDNSDLLRVAGDPFVDLATMQRPVGHLPARSANGRSRAGGLVSEPGVGGDHASALTSYTVALSI